MFVNEKNLLKIELDGCKLLKFLFIFMQSLSRELQKYAIYYFVNRVKGSKSVLSTEFMIFFEVLIGMINWRTETFAFHHGICMCIFS